MKKLLSVILALAMIMVFAAGCAADKTGSDETTAASEETAETAADASSGTDNEQPAAKADMRVYGLKGPTGMGMAKLMSDNDAGTAANNYTFTIASAPDEITAEIIKGDFEAAAVPTNLAAVLYAKTEGQIMVAAVNTLGVLYIMENGDTISSLSDLEGKTIYATGQGSTPEYVLNYILNANNITCDVQYLTEHSELATQMISGDVSIGLLPVPNVTTVLAKSEARIALNMNDEWDKAVALNGDESSLYMGCVVISKSFAEENPDAVAAFLEEYAASVDYVNSNVSEAAELIAGYGIVPSAEIAAAAIPDANIVFITGDEMATGLSGFYKVLYDANPASVGGSLPDENIYYIK